VRTLGKEFFLPAAEVEWLQAWGNYVNVRVRGHDYPLRSTMAAVEAQLDPARFVRVHRSYIMNLDSGDARARMRDGGMVPVEARKGAIASIERYVAENMEDKIGNISAGALLGLFVEEIGPVIYNAAVAEVQERLQTRVMDIDLEAHEDAYPYWRKIDQAKRKK
jgi:uncharacterized protein (DUF2164 family)